MFTSRFACGAKYFVFLSIPLTSHSISLCVAVMACQDLFSVFHGRLKCAVSAAVASIRRPIVPSFL